MVTSAGSEPPNLSNGLPPQIVVSDDEKEYPLEIANEKSNVVKVRVSCPNIGQKYTKMFSFYLNKPVWHAKQMVLIEFSMTPNLFDDPLNFGFYLPPHMGRAGKFLDEARFFREYPLDNVEAHLEFRYKRRIFRHICTPDEKKLLKSNSSKYRKKFLEYLYARNFNEMQKMLEKGLDPNYHDEKTGDTPLISAAKLDNSMEYLKLLVQYGGYLDFRNLKGRTALHVVSAAGRADVVQNFLDLGSSPNYKDGKGLTPLYHSILSGASPSTCELLLKYRAQIGVSDIHGSEEIHQICKLGYVQHLEILLRYGGNVNSRTASGNTPLHICALENQIDCGRVLLQHGADSRILNYAQQSAYDVSVLVNHFDIAKLLHQFDGIYKQPPSPKLDVNENDTASLNSVASEPTPSTATATVSMEVAKDIYGEPDYSSGSDSDSDDEEKKSPRKNYRSFSMVAAAPKRSPAPMKGKPAGTPNLHRRLYASVPGRQYLVINDYEPKHSGELALTKGDLIEVLYIGDGGFWEGHIQGRAGWFPSYLVQEVKQDENTLARQLSWFGKKSSMDVISKAMASEPPEPKMVTLKRSEKGYGFQLRGANSHVPYIDFVPTPQYPALQYLGDIDKGGVAEKVGLKAGDFVLEINDENVINATHGYAVSLINKSSKVLTMKVIAVAPESMSADVVHANGDIRPVNFVEVTEVSKEPSSKDGGKLLPPTPPMRSFSTVLSRRKEPRRDSSFLAEGAVALTAETVKLENSNVPRHNNVKGIWSGNAYCLQGKDIKIREEDISRGIARKQKAVSTDISSEREDKLTSMSMKSPVFTLPYARDRNERQMISSSQSLPDYNTAVKNLAQGRSNSIGKGDNVKLTRSQTYNFETNDGRRIRQGLNKSGNHINHRSLIDITKERNSIIDYNNETYNIHQNHPYATVRQHNINSNSGIIRSQSVHCSTPTRTPYIPFNGKDDRDCSAAQVGRERSPSASQCPESDGLIRLQNQRLEMLKSSSGSLRGTTRPISLPIPDYISGSLPKSHSDGNVKSRVEGMQKIGDFETLYLDDVIADAEASINYDLILHGSSSSLSHESKEANSSSCSGDTRSESSSTEINSSRNSQSCNGDSRSESSTAGTTNNRNSPVEFPPPPQEFLVEGELPAKNATEQIICLRPIERTSLSDLPPPYPPPLSDPPPPYRSGSKSPTPPMTLPNELKNKSFIEWTSDDVCVWLEHLNLGQYKNTFVDNDIEGKHLSELSKDELKELGVTKLGHRMTLDDAINRLCRNTP